MKRCVFFIMTIIIFYVLPAQNADSVKKESLHIKKSIIKKGYKYYDCASLEEANLFFKELKNRNYLVLVPIKGTCYYFSDNREGGYRTIQAGMGKANYKLWQLYNEVYPKKFVQYLAELDQDNDHIVDTHDIYSLHKGNDSIRVEYYIPRMPIEEVPADKMLDYLNYKYP